MDRNRSEGDGPSWFGWDGWMDGWMGYGTSRMGENGNNGTLTPKKKGNGLST